ncbi:MAG: dicarboxylate/amino acid:cation symporter [Candidatus Algichlamydia australiensis]|nr:dicarboxylate/amino acid:cation symporter [Chlamydiales bacterium]
MLFKRIFSTPVSLLLGLIAGYFALPQIHEASIFISDAFLRILKLLSMPLIFLSITATLLNVETLDKLKILFKKVTKYTLFTTFLAAVVGLILFLTIRPAHAPLGASPTVEQNKSVYTLFLNLIPENPFSAFLNQNVIAIVAMAVVFSLAALKTNKKGVISTACQELFAAFVKMTSWAIKLLPIAIFAFSEILMHSLRENQGSIRNLLLYALCVIGANIIQGFVVLPLILTAKGISPLRLGKSMLPALTAAFFSKSSSATLPIALECAENRAKIDSKVAGFSFPLCSVINMNGCAAFILITSLFVAISNGLTFSVPMLLLWVFVSSLAAVGNAGVPMGCFFLTSALLVGLNVPLGMMGLILPLYSIFDMVETSLNVWSDSCVTAIVDQEINHAEVPTSPTPARPAPSAPTH